jgi:glycogen synthase
MKVLMLVREFNHGEFVSEYCKQLAFSLAKNDNETHIVAFGNENFYEKIHEKIHVHRNPLIINCNNFFNWAMMMNNELKRKAREIFETEGFDIIHGNDWITFPAAVSIAKLTEKPLVMTIHSTEKERGFAAEFSSLIEDLEWWSTYEARHVFVNNWSTYYVLKYDFGVPEIKMNMIDQSQKDWCEKIIETYRRLL